MKGVIILQLVMLSFGIGGIWSAALMSASRLSSIHNDLMRIETLLKQYK